MGCESLGVGFSSPENIWRGGGRAWGCWDTRPWSPSLGRGEQRMQQLWRVGLRVSPRLQAPAMPQVLSRPQFHQAFSPATSFHHFHLQPDPPDISPGLPNFGSGWREKTFPVWVSPAATETWPSGRDLDRSKHRRPRAGWDPPILRGNDIYGGDRAGIWLQMTPSNWALGGEMPPPRL